MRHRFIGLLLWLTTLGMPLGAWANCSIIDGVDKLHGVQMRLMQSRDSVLFASDIRFLRAQVRVLADRQVLEAIGSTSLSPKGAAFLRFMRNTRELLQTASVDDPSSVSRFFWKTNVRTNLQSVGRHLDDLRCTPEQISYDLAALQNAGDEDLEDVLQQALDQALNPTNYIILAAGILIAISGGRMVRAYVIGQRRRSQRYPAKYETVYKFGAGAVHSGVLIDISGKGTKLGHDPETPVAPKTEIEIMILGRWRKGVVRWSNAHYAGVSFKRSLKSRTVSQIQSDHGSARASTTPTTA